MDRDERKKLLDELPRRTLNGEHVVYKEFEDLEALVSAYAMGSGDADFVRREIVARREKFGLKAGLQRNPAGRS